MPQYLVAIHHPDNYDPSAEGEEMVRDIDVLNEEDGVIKVSGEDGDFPYGDWTAPYRTPAGREAIIAAHGESFDLLLGRRTYGASTDAAR